MGCNLYTWMSSIQTKDLPICGPRSGMICKTMKPSTRKCGYCTRYQWPWMGGHIFHVLWMHWKGLTSLRYNIYIWIPSIQATYHQSCGLTFCRICKPTSHLQGGVDYDMMINGYGWVDMHFICLVNVWEIFDNPGMQSIYMDALHLAHRPPKMWAHVWQDL